MAQGFDLTGLWADPAAVVALDHAAAAGLLVAGGRARGGPMAAILHRAGLCDPEGRFADGFLDLWAAEGADLAARLSFMTLALADVARHGAALFDDAPAFRARAGAFRFFDYAAARGTDAEALAVTRPWVAYVSALTRTEAPVLAPVVAELGLGRVLEVGGNSGAFARALLARDPALRVSVLDLPAVCALGRAAGPDMGGRLEFLAGDMLAMNWRTALGARPDAVLFKSVLHDWPTAEAAQLIAKGLRLSGRVVVVERAAYAPGQIGPAGAENVADLVFAHHYRNAADYVALARAADPRVVARVTPLRLAMDWFVLDLTTGQAPPHSP